MSDVGKGAIPSRTTGRPFKKLPNGVGLARRILSEAEVADGLRLDEEALEVLRRCSRLPAPRNVMGILKALDLRLQYSQKKPKQEMEHSGAVSIRVVNPYAREPGDG